MDKLIKQFFGDAKRLQLSSQEKAVLWQGISTFASAKQIAMSSREKAESFDVITSHMKRYPMPVKTRFSASLQYLFHAHKLVASLMIAVIIIGAGGGSVAYAAQDALPGDALYTLKVDVTEPLIDAAVSFDPEWAAEWERRRLKRRLKEAESLSSNASLTADRRALLQQHVEQRMAMIQNRLDNVPEEKRALMQHRVDDVMERHQKFLDAVEEGTVTKEEVRAFKDHVHHMRNRAHEKWGGRPRGPSDRSERKKEREEMRKEKGGPALFNEDNILQGDHKNRKIPQDMERRKEEFRAPTRRGRKEAERDFQKPSQIHRKRMKDMK